MKIQTAIPRVSAKLKKSSTPYECNGETVFIFSDKENGDVWVDYTTEYKDIFKVKKEDIKPARKGGYSSIKSTPRDLSDEEKTDKDELNLFYIEASKVMPDNCMECRGKLYAFNDFGKRSCTAHILAKSKFPSIATNIHNVIFLGAGFLGGCDCHTEFDNCDAAHRKTMNVYNDVVASFLTYLRHELTDKELLLACKYLALNWQDYL